MVVRSLLSIAFALASGAASVAAAPHNLTSRAVSFSFPYGSSTKVRGVNLGGWLVLEPWITPSLFDGTGDSRIIDEYTFGQYQSYNTAHQKLVQHWNTWITQDDFRQIRDAGLNHVRLPVGYWAYDISNGEPYHQGQHPYVLRAVEWARQYGIKVIIDLHGAPGSQNGFDNSGQKMSYPLWHTNQQNVARTNAIIKRLASEFSSQTDTVVGIAPLNEPAGFYGDDVLSVTRQYWYDSYGNIRYPYGNSNQGNLLNVIHDAFQPLSYWSGFQAYPQFEGVMMDTHQYQVFSNGEVAMSQEQHIQTACSKGDSLANFHLWTIVGEWSNAITDCARYLNGRGVGARYDGTYPGSPYVGNCAERSGSSNNWSSQYKTYLRRFWEAQVTAYERGSGWIFWTWKNEGADDWSYLKGLQGGWIPQNPSDRLYPGICG